MGKRIVTFKEEARNKMVEGMNILANAVKVTLGPKGRGVAIERGYGFPYIVNDGVSIANEIQLVDRLQNMGAQLIRQVSVNTNTIAGDGTTTSTVLAQALILAGMDMVNRGQSPVVIRKQLEIGLKKVLGKIDLRTKKIDTDEELEHVATISSNSEELGHVIADSIKQVGKDGIITVEDSQKIGITSEIIDGFKIAERGYISPYFINKSDKSVYEAHDCKIFITDQKIVYMKQLLPLLTEMTANNIKNLLILAEDVEQEPLQNLVANHLRGVINVCVVKTPWLGTKKEEVLTDWCTMTGATLISSDSGMKIEDTELSMLGSAKKVIVEKYTTSIIGGNGDKEKIKARYDALDVEYQGQIKKLSTFDDTAYKSRLGILGGKVLVLKVGSASETELKDLKLRIEDAINATKSAMKYGMVAGAGITLLNISNELGRGENDGEKILSIACRAPFEQILENSGEDVSKIETEIFKNNDVNYGYDSANNKFGNLLELGVVDPVQVTKEAITNAVSIASMFLTTEATITFTDEDEKHTIEEN